MLIDISLPLLFLMLGCTVGILVFPVLWWVSSPKEKEGELERIQAIAVKEILEKAFRIPKKDLEQWQ